MSGCRILSESQLDEMVELRERGWSYARIARHFTARGTQVSSGSINWQCLRIGAIGPLDRQMRETKPRSVCMRNGHEVRPFTPEEDQRLLKLEQSGIRISEIARALNRKDNSIRGRLYTLARHDAVAEEAALG